jgi:transketolase
MTPAELDQLASNAIRALSIDAVQQAKSGHPGTPMALAPLVYTIWNRAVRFDLKDSIWPDGDRFALSNGHASMLLWSMLHLTQTRAVSAEYERLGQPSVTLDDIRRFRQLGSKRRNSRSIIWCRASRPQRGRWSMGSPPASAWRPPASDWPADTTSRASRCSTTTSHRSRNCSANLTSNRRRSSRSFWRCSAA